MKRTVIALVALAVLGAGVTTVAISARREASPRAATEELGANASRFVDLTGGANAPASFAAAGDADAEEDEGAAAEPVEGAFTPRGWKVTPAGEQVATLRFPLGLTPTPDGAHVVVSSDSGGMQGLTVVRTADLGTTTTTAGNLFMGLAATPDGVVYASGGNANRLFRFQLTGDNAVALDATEAATFPVHGLLEAIASRSGAPTGLPALDGIRVSGYPGNSLLDGSQLYVAGTLGEPTGADGLTCPDARPACSRVTVLDVATNTVVARVPVGLDAYALALDSERDRLYVSNWADEAGRGDGAGGTVSVIDVADPAAAQEIGWTRVGHHPSAVQLSADGSRLFVANTNDDTISVLDVSGDGAPAVIATESVRPVEGVPVGAHPDAFALSPDGGTLFVALAGLNAVEVRDGRSAARLGGAPYYIPTGVYPSALTVTGDAGAYRLWVANAKGNGAGAGINLSVGGDINPFHGGSLSVIDLPVTTEQGEEWTEQVIENDHLDDAEVDPCNPGAGIDVSEVLCPPAGETSPVKHVVYIVTENKTFDQYFGDLDPARYDADPSFLLYGEPFTPNHHAFVDRFSLNDRFFSDGEVSVTGHSWTSGAIATADNEVTWQADYDEGIRGNHGNGDPLREGVGGEAGGEIADAENELDDPEGGYIFEAFKRAGAEPPGGTGGLTMAIYGESTARESGDMSAYQAPSWGGGIEYFDSCRAALFLNGATVDGPGPNSPGQFQDCGDRTMADPFTLQHWTEVWNAGGGDVMPNFIYMTLPVNHTLGTNLGSPTPASMVADNDYALGLIVEGLSNSPFWESTVVMMTEDDTQAAGDHVSYLRDYLQVVGPWTKPGPNHQWGSMPSLLRTIEQLFGVEPISLFDELSLPQHGAFRASLSDTPDTAPYTALRSQVPFAVNEPGAPGQAASMAMDWSSYDLIDEATLNAILYTVQRGVPLDLPDYAEPAED